MVSEGQDSKTGSEAGKELQRAIDSSQKISEDSKPRSFAFAAEGIRTSRQFAGMMSALMSDILEGRISPQVSNAVVNAGGKLLKVVEMQLKYGTQSDTGKVLNLTSQE